MTFIVLVTCAHLSACPIPHGYRIEAANVASKGECVAQAQTIIRALGFQPVNFHIRCTVK